MKISGGLIIVDDVVGFRSYSLKETSLRSVVIGEVTSLQLTPLLVDLRIFPPTPTATKVSLPKATPLSSLEIGVLLEVQLLPLEEVMIFPELPTATNVLFPKVTPFNVVPAPEFEKVQL